MVFPPVFEEVLLRPSTELGGGDLGYSGLPVGADEGGLMSVWAQFADFAHPELFVVSAADVAAAFGEKHAGLAAVHEWHGDGCEFVLRPVFAGVFMIGLAGDAFLPHAFEEAGAVGFAVKNEPVALAQWVGFEFLCGGLTGQEGFEFGHDLFFDDADEAGIDGLVDFEIGQAARVR